MGQVPEAKFKGGALSAGLKAGAPSAILVIGDGRLASALIRLLAEKSKLHPDLFKFQKWFRASSTSLDEAFAKFDATHVWLAISDDSIAKFADEHRSLLANRLVVHFSGSRPSFGGVHVAHPLMTFARTDENPMTSDAFDKVPFVLDLEGPELFELLPGFTNPTYRLDPKLRPYYHALCAISGNFTILLWEAVAERFEKKLGLPKTVLDAYRTRVFENLASSKAESVLTGPLARADFSTIQKHRDSLLGQYEMPLLKIYEGFIDLYRTRQNKSKEKA